MGGIRRSYYVIRNNNVIGNVLMRRMSGFFFFEYSSLPDHTNHCGEITVNFCTSLYLDIISLLIFKA